MTWTNPDHVDEAIFSPEAPLEPDVPEAPETTVAQELLTEEEMYVLADARKTLKIIEDRARDLSHDERVTATKGWVIDQPSAFDIGKFHEAIGVAEHMIFEAMNTASSYCKVEVPTKIMHPHSEEEM